MKHEPHDTEESLMSQIQYWQNKIAPTEKHINQLRARLSSLREANKHKEAPHG